MKNIEAITFIYLYHRHLDDFITSIHAIKNQNLDYEITFKDWTRTKDFTIVQQENESVEEVKERAETLLDQIYELIDRNNLIIQGMNEFVSKIEELKNVSERYLKKLDKDENVYETKMKELERFINEKIEEMRKKELKEYEEAMRKVKEINEKYEKEKEEVSKGVSFNIDKKRFQKMNLNTYEIKQIEEWTNKKVGEVVFDSNIHNWRQNTSEFDSKVFNRSNLIFVVEDESGNKFGGYVNTKIDKYYWKEYGQWKGQRITDPKAFVFSL